MSVFYSSTARFDGIEDVEWVTITDGCPTGVTDATMPKPAGKCIGAAMANKGKMTRVEIFGTGCVAWVCYGNGRDLLHFHKAGGCGAEILLLNPGDFVDACREPPKKKTTSGKKFKFMEESEACAAASLNSIAADVHHENKKWWEDPKTGERIERNKGEQLMLIVSEIAEAMEGERKDLMDDHLPHRKMVEVELADAVIRIMDYAEGHGLDLGTAMLEKLAYNRDRADHKPEARLEANGKKW